MKKVIVAGILILMSQMVLAQDSVDVSFYYYPDDNPSSVHIPGEFNGWDPTGSISEMSYDAAEDAWWKTIRLRVGGPDPLPSGNSIEGAYQYKFHDGSWFPDPLNPRQNPSDNNNTYLYINDPTIHLLLPNSTPASGIVRSRHPEITAFLFPSVGTAVNPASITVTIDGTIYSDIGAGYDLGTHQFSFVAPDALGDGDHDLTISATTIEGNTTTESTSFTVSADLIQFHTLPAQTWKDGWRLQGAVYTGEGELDLSINSVDILRDDASWSVSVNSGLVDTTIELIVGDNLFQIEAVIDGITENSSVLTIHQWFDHTPTVQVDITSDAGMITFSADESSDPDGGPLNYIWGEHPDNPESLGLDGATDMVVNVSVPSTNGEYFISLIVEDEAGESATTERFFLIADDGGTVDVAGYADNAEWVKQSSIYLLFFKAFTPEGTIAAAIPNLDYIAAMGFNTIWVLPVMEIPGDVDNQINIGYYIEDFMQVESSYGTAQDYKDFVDAAHDHGLKVIQDVTPNHSGRVHAFAEEAMLYGEYSQYWNYYQTDFIEHNTNGLDDCFTDEGIHFYCGFSDALLSWDWRDLDARNYMIDVYEYWITEFGIDGYRYDVYWGPHRKFGESNMGTPMREALRHIKPDIMLLGEDDGTGPGTEVLYADQGGGLDVCYDFSAYFSSIRNFGFNTSSVNSLHSAMNNGGYHPGENSYFMRFMESQDEDRIAYNYNSFDKTMPMASVILTAPGIPMILNGQEVGFGLGMGNPGEPDLNDRRRGVIDWEFAGRDLLTPHYQRLTQIRSQFPAFWQHKIDSNGDGSVTSADESDFDRVYTGSGIVYSFLRPYINSNGLTVVNFDDNQRTGVLDLEGANLKFDDDFSLDSTYWLNNHYTGVSIQVSGQELQNFNITLPAYGTAIFTISNSEEQVEIPELPLLQEIDAGQVSIPDELRLHQNFPNPFNPTTRIRYHLPESTDVELIVYDLTGKIIAKLISESQQKGYHEVNWNGNRTDGLPLSTGLYFAHLQAGQNSKVIKMIFLQ